jgi:hypothetical protein
MSCLSAPLDNKTSTAPVQGTVTRDFGTTNLTHQSNPTIGKYTVIESRVWLKYLFMTTLTIFYSTLEEINLRTNFVTVKVLVFDPPQYRTEFSSLYSAVKTTSVSHTKKIVNKFPRYVE